MKRIFNLITSLRFIPHIIVYYRSHNRNLLDYERDRWLNLNRFSKQGVRGFLMLLVTFPEYRSLFYFRTGKQWLNIFAKGQTNLYFHMKSSQIGKGLVIWHGYSTVLNAISIGEDFQVWHNVTIGKKTTSELNDKPIIGNNVSICTGAVVIGKIVVGDNSIVGANATVVKDIPKNSTAIGVAANIMSQVASPYNQQ